MTWKTRLSQMHWVSAGQPELWPLTGTCGLLFPSIHEDLNPANPQSKKKGLNSLPARHFSTCALWRAVSFSAKQVIQHIDNKKKKKRSFKKWRTEESGSKCESPSCWSRFDNYQTTFYSAWRSSLAADSCAPLFCLSLRNRAKVFINVKIHLKKNE